MRHCSIVRLFACLIVCLALSLTANAADKVQTRVSVTSQPSGATVIVDGQDRGTTPITLFDLKPGRHHLKYRLAGYCERDRFFSTDEGPFIEKNEVLVEEKGLLLLKTDPPGADIQINGDSVGQTPRLITHLAAKDTYSVRLRKAGYQDQKISVRFDGRKPLVREEKMVLASGTINILSEPSGAEVTVNGIVRVMNDERQLLVGIVGINVRVGGDFGSYLNERFNHTETSLGHDRMSFIFRLSRRFLCV